jgi:hypothetical protein
VSRDTNNDVLLYVKAERILKRAFNTAYNCFIGNQCRFYLIIQDEWTPNLFITSTAVAVDQNQESLPTQPDFGIPAPSTSQSTLLYLLVPRLLPYMGENRAKQ